jgi:hypothetical protein
MTLLTCERRNIIVNQTRPADHQTATREEARASSSPNPTGSCEMASHIDGPLYYERMGRTGPVIAFEIIDKLNREINTALADPKIKARLAELGGPPIVGSPADFAKIIADDTEKWAKVIKISGAKPN